MKYWESILLVVACTTFFLLSYRASPQKSAAFDEQFHLTAGYTYAQTGDARLANNHPPLMGLIASLPLLTQDNIHLPLEHPSWEDGNRFLFSDQFFWYAGNQTQAMLESARIPIILVGVLLLLTIFSWARLAFNSRWASWVALGLAVFDPNLLANSRLVTTDLGVTTFLFLSLFFLWLALKQDNQQTQPEHVSTALFLRPLPISLFMAGICAGFALAAKYNGVLIAPLALALILVYPRWHWPRLAWV